MTSFPFFIRFGPDPGRHRPHCRVGLLDSASAEILTSAGERFFRGVCGCRDRWAAALCCAQKPCKIRSLFHLPGKLLAPGLNVRVHGAPDMLPSPSRCRRIERQVLMPATVGSGHAPGRNDGSVFNRRPHCFLQGCGSFPCLAVPDGQASGFALPYTSVADNRQELATSRIRDG